MERSDSERRKVNPKVPRTPFGELVRGAMKRRVTGARAHDAHWEIQPNLTWVRWAREDRHHVYFAIRRRGDCVTGEIGVAPWPLDLDELPLVRQVGDAPRDGCRIQLGFLLHGHDKWWSSGGSEPALIERLEWLGQQMQFAMSSFLSSVIDPAA